MGDGKKRMHYYLGLDNGGTTTKAALFDEKGREVGCASVSTRSIVPRPDFVERDPEEMWRANCQVIRELLSQTQISAGDIAGVGICGHGKGLYLWGKDGKPVRNGIISTDNRAYKYQNKWRGDGTEEKVFPISLQHVMACQPVALLAWLKDNEPENYYNIKYVFECKDYVRFRLTGEARAEITDYSGANLLNLNTVSYDRELLALFGLEEIWEALPPLCKAADIVGQVTELAARETGLCEGTPVIGGMFDINACALAAGVTDPERICLIAGTWSINEYVRETPVTDGGGLMNSVFCLPEYYLIEESSATSAGNNEWFVKQMLPELKADADARGESVYDLIDRWVEEIPPEEFVPVFLPFLMASNVHPNAKGSFLGISLHHTRKHLVRSVFEGITFCHRYHLDKLLATREEPPRAIRLAGGAAKAGVWAQMFADVMQIPVETVGVKETGALGCAIAVAAAVGDHPTLSAAAGNMSVVSGIYQPRADKKEIYEKKYQLYLKSIACLDNLWDDMQRLIES